MATKRNFSLSLSLLSAALVWPVTGALANGGTAHSHTDGGHTQVLGKPGKANQASRTVNVEMSDAMRFQPASVTVRRGETIRFVVRNAGHICPSPHPPTPCI